MSDRYEALFFANRATYIVLEHDSPVEKTTTFNLVPLALAQEAQHLIWLLMAPITLPFLPFQSPEPIDPAPPLHLHKTGTPFEPMAMLGTRMVVAVVRSVEVVESILAHRPLAPVSIPFDAITRMASVRKWRYFRRDCGSAPSSSRRHDNAFRDRRAPARARGFGGRPHP